jgi:alpha-mannosidase
LERGALRQELVYEVSLGNSRIKTAVRLEAGRAQLDYALECDWQEIGRKGQGVPQLSFHLPLAHASAAYRYDVPLGVTQRPALALDVPALSWGFAVREGEGEASVQLISRLGYGMRGEADTLSLSLLRSSYDPDAYPEVGMHHIEFSLAVTGSQASNSQLAQSAFACQHPFSVLSGAGSQPVEAGYLSLEGGTALVAGIKLPEDGADAGSLLVRVYEVDGRGTQVRLRFERHVRLARLVDVHEQPLAEEPEVQIDGQEVRFPLGACRVGTVWVEF